MLLVESLELGLWHYEQLDKLMETLYERCENLHKVEENIKRDGDKIPEHVAKQMLGCKESVATSILQIIIFYNDYWFVQTCKSINDKIPKRRTHVAAREKKEGGGPSHYYLKPFQHCDKNYNFWSLIIFNYLFVNVEYEENTLISDEFRTTMHHILMMVYDTRLDPFVISLDMIKREYLMFYFMESIEEDFMNNINEVQKNLNELFEKPEDSVTKTEVERLLVTIFDKLEYL